MASRTMLYSNFTVYYKIQIIMWRKWRSLFRRGILINMTLLTVIMRSMTIGNLRCHYTAYPNVYHIKLYPIIFYEKWHTYFISHWNLKNIINPTFTATISSKFRSLHGLVFSSLMVILFYIFKNYYMSVKAHRKVATVF